MVKVYCKKIDGVYREFIFKGHANYGKAGKDIVCSAVSVLFINTMNSIEKFTEDTPRVMENSKNRIIIEFDSNITKEATLLLDSMMLGLRETQEEYSDYMSLILKEV